MTTERLDSSTIDRGTKIGRFVVVHELGSGGMGAVYAAHDPQLDRQVALKVMRGATGEDEDRIRMLREGQAMARVTHPNVITVYEVGTEGGSVFLAQELLDGGTLGEWLKKPRERTAIIDKFIAAGRGLAAAHAADLVHRDFKPDNVLLGKDGRVRVADFGLARAATALGDALATTQKGGGPRVDADPMASPMSALTRTGTVMGTPMFMAPEQHKGERADAQSDQFAFCVSLYHALYSAWPFDGKTAPALADAVIEGRMAPAPKNADVPARVRKILVRGLATEQAARYPSMTALLADLEPEVRPAQRSRLPFMLGTLALVLAAGGAAAYVLLLRGDDKKPTVVAPTPVIPTGVETPTTDDGIGWITTAIDKGQLGNAIEKLDLAVGIAARDGKPAQAAIAQAAGAYMRVLRAEPADLKSVDATLEQATKQAAGNPLATAYVDLADAALSLARGKLNAAWDRSQACAAALEASAPVLAATCYQIHGDAQAALGDAKLARAAYVAGLDLATKQKSAELESTLRLAIAQVDLESQHPEAAADVAKVLTECSDRDAIGCEVYARILLSRVRLLASDNDRASAETLLAEVKPTKIEAFPVKMAHAIALGQVNGFIGEAGEDTILGLDRIESARAQAEVRGLVGLVFEAKLARVRVLLIQSADDAAAEVAALAKQARAAKFERIARLAEASLAELAEPPRAMLPADGGLPAVPTGSSGAP